MDAEKEKLNDGQKDSRKDNLDFITEIDEIIDPEKKRIRQKREKEALERAKKRKLIPPFVMLSAGAIVSITLFLLRYKMKDMLIILLCVLIVFYFAGELMKWMFDRFEAQIEEARLEEGEVIEKEPDTVLDTDRRREVAEQTGKTAESSR